MQFYQTIAESSLCPVAMVICSRGNEARLRNRAKVLKMDEARRLAANIARPKSMVPQSSGSLAHCRSRRFLKASMRRADLGQRRHMSYS